MTPTRKTRARARPGRGDGRSGHLGGGSERRLETYDL